jgi:hypothetical protein
MGRATKVTQAQRTRLNSLCNPKHFDALCCLAVLAYILANRDLDEAAIADSLSDEIGRIIKETTRKLKETRKRNHSRKVSKPLTFCDLAPEQQVQKTLAFVVEVSSKSGGSSRKSTRKPAANNDHLNDPNEIMRYPFNTPVRNTTSSIEPGPCSPFLSPAGSPISILYDEELVEEWNRNTLSEEQSKEQSEERSEEQSEQSEEQFE